MKALKRIDGALGSLERGLLAVLLSVMILLSFVQVILRGFFSMGLLWGDTFLRHLVLWVGFLGAAVATSENGHFAIDIVRKSLPDRAKKYAAVATGLFASACLFALSDGAVKFFRDGYQAKSALFTVNNFEVPAWWMDLIIPAGFILLSVHFALKTAQSILRLFSSEPEEEVRE